jgi:hypothetical protein
MTDYFLVVVATLLAVALGMAIFATIVLWRLYSDSVELADNLGTEIDELKRREVECQRLYGLHEEIP